MTDAEFQALKARLEGYIDIATHHLDVAMMLKHTTQLRAAIGVILEVDPAFERDATIAHLRAWIGETDANLHLP